MSRVAGIDFSTRTVDVVLLDEDTNEADWHRFELTALPGWDAFDRTRSIRAIMPSRSWWDDIIAIGIEDPRGYGAGHLYRVQGAILQCLPPDLLVQPWIPSAWRKAVGLPGNAPKQAIAERVAWEWFPGAASWPEDACDAYCVARATRDALEREIAA